MKTYKVFRVLLPLFVFYFVSALVVFLIRLIPLLYEDDLVDVSELVILSAYYYENSESMGNHSISMVLTGEYSMLERISKLDLTVANQHTSAEISTDLQRITPHDVCKWIAIMTTVPTLPNLEKLIISTGGKDIQVPFQIAPSQRRDYISCIAPLFANEQWQMIIFAAHTYRKFGSHMHVYLRSATAPIYRLLKLYEGQGYLSIQPWLRLEGDENVFNPNINIEFRNQAAAQTDCLLQHKESARFISFVDLDDILIPRLARTYAEEFDILFEQNPHAAYLHYPKENAHVVTHRRGDDFTLESMFRSVKFQQQTETGKMVTRPGTINGTWIHWPVVVPPGMNGYAVPSNVNALLHIKRLSRAETPVDLGLLPYFDPDPDHEAQLLLNQTDLDDIVMDFKRFYSLESELPSLMKEMPRTFFYHKIIDSCFEETFYTFHYSHRTTRIKCPGPERCQLPKDPGIQCYNSAATWHSATGNRLKIYYATDLTFIGKDGCDR